MPFQTAIFASELLWSKMFRKFPGLKLALAEGGIGWMPYFLEKADFVYDHHRAWTGEDFGDQLPEPGVPPARAGLLHRRRSPAFATATPSASRRITWECDYPHSDSTWPTSPEVLWKSVHRRRPDDDEIEMVSWANAARWYQFDPFEHRSTRRCTVGALRAQAADVDTTPREYGDAPHTHKLEAAATKFIDQQDINNPGVKTGA